jgi:hypothetical protein
MPRITRALAAAAILAVGAASAQGQTKILTHQKAVEVCQQFEGLTPPAPPIGSAVVGTFDAQSGEFIWNPHVTMRRNPLQDPTTNVADVGRVFDRYNIRAISPNLDPRITSLPQGLVAIAFSPDNLSRLRARPGATSARRPGTRARAAQDPAGAGRGQTSESVTSRTPLRGHPPDRYHWMYLPVNGGMQDLIFKAVNLPAEASFAVTIDDRTVSNAGSAQPDVLDIVVPARGSVLFKLEVKGRGPREAGRFGSKSFTEIVAFDRPPSLGCFTLEALPVAISYEPPGSGSSQTYTTAQHLGNMIRSFSGTKESSTKPVATAFSTVGDMVGILGGVGKAVSGAASVIPALAGVGEGLQTASSILTAAWGSSETTETNSYSVTNEHTLEVNVESSDALKTSAHLGPGKGDLIQFLTKPVFAWLAATDSRGQLFLSVSLLGFKGPGTHSAEDLRNPAVPIPVPSGAKNLLLALDPLTPEYKQAHPTPEPGRLVPIAHSQSFSGGTQVSVYQRTITQTDITTESTSRNVTTTEVGGFLSYVATNVPKTGTTSLTTTHGGTKGVTVGSTVQLEVVLSSPPGEYHEFDTFYDRKFGTFTFHEVPVGDTVAAGMVASTSGAARPGTRVELVTRGRKFTTWTDAQGRYAFRSRRLKSGSYEIVVEGTRQPLRLEGKRVTANITVAPRSEIRDGGAAKRSPGAERLKVRPRRK